MLRKHQRSTPMTYREIGFTKGTFAALLQLMLQRRSLHLRDEKKRAWPQLNSWF
jgi:hypothetical protein